MKQYKKMDFVLWRQKIFRMGVFSLWIIFCLAFYHEVKAQDKVKYRFAGDGSSFTVSPDWNNDRKSLRTLHSDENEYVQYDEYFNRAVKRGRTILSTGDKPRFALLYTENSNRMDPDMNKMGDGRIRLTVDGKETWLDEWPKIKTIFTPSSTEYTCSSSLFPKLVVRLLVSQAGDWGAVVRLYFRNSSGFPIQLKADLRYGGIRKCGRTFSAAYFSPNDKEDVSANKIEITGKQAKLSDAGITGDVFIISKPSVKPVQIDHYILFPGSVTIAAGKEQQIFYILGLSLQQKRGQFEKLTEHDPLYLIRESKEYYADILRRYEMNTPSNLLNNGFKTALINFDNLYTDPAWLEGIHWWSAYWTNNFQIAAAIALHQNNRARKALAFYNSAEYGPAPVMSAAGKADNQSKSGEDGLPYYIYNLIQYFNSTGDSTLVLQVWPGLRKSIDLLWQNRDGDGNGLLNWHLGANAFMYQADHLEMPGDAASPSLMMAGMLEKLSVIGFQLGQTHDATRWRMLSEKVYLNLDSILWNKKSGAFYNHKDNQGLLHSAHYYSDLVYPSLYTSLPAIYGWQSLNYLYRTLWTNNYKGEKTLMRVGDFKPSIFGNDNVMPVQMAEAARAYFNEGENEKGIKLMESISLAATIFTEAPGNFPERMNDEGKGEANYLFGNPIASFICSIVNGVFGLELKEKGKMLRWQPSFPAQWNHASLKLPYAKVSYKKTVQAKGETQIYDIKENESRVLDFYLYMVPATAITIKCNGEGIAYSSSPALEKTVVHFQFQKAIHHLITVQYTPVVMDISGKKMVHQNDSVTWNISGGIEKIIDPQHLLKNYTISGNRLSVVTGQDTGWHTIFIQSKQLPVIHGLDYYSMPGSLNKSSYFIKTADFQDDQKVPLDISAWYNTNRIFLSSRWRYEYALRDSVYLSGVNDTTKIVFANYGYSPKRPSTLAMTNNGISDMYSAETKNNGMPGQMEIPVNRKLRGLSFLWVSEMQSRNTGIRAGSILLNYSDGGIDEIPLIVGESIDASWKYFASDTEPVFLQGEDYAKICSVRCDSERELKSFKIVLTAADVQIGILGVNMILPSKEKLPVVGAIRWDGWFYDTSNFVTQIVQKTLAPKEFHDRLPFFAREISEDSVYVNGSSQEVMDQEIEFAKKGRLDYWAFVLYSPGEKLSLAFENYLRSTHRRDIHFSIITEQARVIPTNAVYLNYITKLLQEPGYQLVSGGRPLWYLGFIDSANVKQAWGSFGNMRRALDSIRAIVMKSGLENPYLVIMDFNASLGKRWSDSLGGDAISSYACNNNSMKAPYKKLTMQTEAFWEECRATGSQVVPIIMAGWSPKPRLDYPNTWTHFYPKDVYYSNATAKELGSHVRQGLKWLQNNRSSASAQCALIYAWNEYDEGGWIDPTLYYGTDRLDELSMAIKAFKRLP